MSFLIYFFVLLVSAASVLFGLDLMNSPLPRTPNVPIGRPVQVTAQPPAAEQQKRAADESALTPVYPTTAGAPKVPAQTSGAAPQEEAKVMPPPANTLAQAPAEPAPPKSEPSIASQATEGKTAAPAPAATVAQTPPAALPSAQAAAPLPAQNVAQAPPVSEAPAAAAAPPVPVAQQPLAPPAATQAAAQPAAQQATNSCNVQTCGAAYHSFRASDCSYQPASGPRRACSMGSATIAAAKPQQPARQVGGKNDLREVERIVKQQPLDLQPSAQGAAADKGDKGDKGEMSEVERIVRHMTRNENADVAVQDADGKIIIVRKSYR